MGAGHSLAVTAPPRVSVTLRMGQSCRTRKSGFQESSEKAARSAGSAAGWSLRLDVRKMLAGRALELTHCTGRQDRTVSTGFFWNCRLCFERNAPFSE
jgi:hypothetical protein